MVAGKVKVAMGFQRSPATPKAETPRRSSSSPAFLKPPPPTAPSHPTPPSSNGKNVFVRSFGAYFPRSSSQVQPRPPDVAEMVRLLEELQERESRLRTQLVEQKLLQETVAIVPFLEKEIAARGDDLARASQQIERLEAENQLLRDEIEALRSKIWSWEETNQRREKRIRDLEIELEEAKKRAYERSNGDAQRHSVRTVDGDECSSSQRFHGLNDSSTRLTLSRSFRKVSKSVEIGSNHDDIKPNAINLKAETGEVEVAHQPLRGGEKEEVLRHRTPRVPRPPPTPLSSGNSSTSSSSSASSSYSETASSVMKSKGPNSATIPPIPPLPAPIGSRPPPPPPPPPSSKGSRTSTATVRRVPEVVEFYHSLMRRDSKRESASGISDASPAASAASNARDMIGEIENRSSHLLAIKIDVETQGDFIRFLIKEVQHAAFTNIEDVVPFVKWLDDELSYLVDERAVLKHFEWPEQKADAMREAAFGYCDLKKLEAEASSFRDDPRQPCSSALKKMKTLLEKLEQVVYNLSRARESAMKRYRGFGIPWEWMQESGYVAQIKLASVKLAMKFMKRVSSELKLIAGSPEEELLMLQGVRFAFRVHQFAGGFDVETMRAFQDLKDKASNLILQNQHQTANQASST